MVGHALSLGMAGERRFPAGDLTSRVVGSAPHAAGTTALLVDAAAGLSVSVGALVALFLIDWRIVVTLGLAAPFAVVIASVLMQRTADLSGRYQRAQGELAVRFVDASRGARTIRACDTVAVEARRIFVPLGDIAEAARAMWDTQGTSAGRIGALAPLISLAGLAVAGQGVAAGRITPGQLLAAAAYLPMAIGTLDQVGTLASLAANRASAHRLAEVLAVPAPVSGSARLAPGPGHLVLRDVSVFAGSSLVLLGLTLDVPGGTSLAVVGRSGAGKSTLARVAGGLVHPDVGHVTLDGVALDQLHTVDLRSAVAYAFERPTLLGTTIADAIGYGAGGEAGSGADGRPTVEQAAGVAQVGPFIQRMPSGFDTTVDLLPLSGGERQRLGLARAIAHGGRLLIMDDATSSLDTVTEAQLRAALAQAAPDRTRLVVAHRASTARSADRVVWLEAGRIRRVGTHDELWADADYRAVFHEERAPTRPRTPTVAS